MGRTANISPMGLYNWDNTIFDLLVIPEALDRDTLINNLLLETAELEVLYTSPVTFRYAVGQWSKKELDIWERLYATTQYEYDPIENYNRYETGEDEGTRTEQHSGTDSHTNTETHSGTDSRTHGTEYGGTDRITGSQDGTKTDGGSETEETDTTLTQGGSDTLTNSKTDGHWVAGFDAPAAPAQGDGLVKQTRDESDGTATTAYGKTETGTAEKTTTFGKTERTTGSNTESTAYGRTIDETDALAHGESISTTGGTTHGQKIETENSGEHNIHAHGNIGVTTTQELIKEQRQIERFNIYDFIIDDFKMRFCVLVY